MAGTGFTPTVELQHTVAVTDRLIKGKGKTLTDEDRQILRDLRAKILDVKGKTLKERQALADQVLKAVILWGEPKEQPSAGRGKGGDKNGLEVGLYRLGSVILLVHWNEAGTYKYAEEWDEAAGRFKFQKGLIKDLTPRHKLTPPQEREVCRKFPAVLRKVKQLGLETAA